MEFKKITIVMPALNEEKNVGEAIENTVSAFYASNLQGEILVIDNGSTDNTSLIVKEKINKYPHIIKLFMYKNPIGLGGSFWVGVKHCESDIICMIPGDNENKLSEVLRYFYLTKHVDMVIPFIVNKQVRSKFRNILSFAYRSIINNTFFLSLNYTNGTVMYNSHLLKMFMFKEKGFFYQTDILIRLIKRGYTYAEVPCRLGTRNIGKSKAISFPALAGVIKGYIKLVIDIYFRRTI